MTETTTDTLAVSAGAKNEFVTVAAAVQSAVSWTKSTLLERHGDKSFGARAETITPIMILEIARAVLDGVIATKAAGSATTAASMKQLTKAVRSGDAQEVGPMLALFKLDRGSFHSWLALAPLESLLGAALPEPAPADLDSKRVDVTPLEAVTLMAFGEAWSSERVNARGARALQVRGMLADDRAGKALLGDAARQCLWRQYEADVAHDDELNKARIFLEALIRGGPEGAFSVAAARPLTSADFVTPIWLDVLLGEFIPSVDLPLFDEERERARAACARIGPVRLSAEALLCRGIGKPARTRVTTASHARARLHLHKLIAQWISGEGQMPKKCDWLVGDGLAIAGSKRAARDVWDEVVQSDERFAPLRRPGRRKSTP
jgi:hypothetical protein